MNITLNLLPWRVQRRRQRWRRSWLALAGSVLSAGVVWWQLDASASMRLDAQQQHNQVLAEQLAALQSQIDALEQHAEQQRAKALARARIERERLALVQLLDRLSRHTPDTVVLSEVQQQGETLALTARAANHPQIATTVQQWNPLGEGTATLSAIRADRQGGYAFTLSVPWPIRDEDDSPEVTRVEIAHMEHAR